MTWKVDKLLIGTILVLVSTFSSDNLTHAQIGDTGLYVGGKPVQQLLQDNRNLEISNFLEEFASGASLPALPANLGQWGGTQVLRLKEDGSTTEMQSLFTERDIKLYQDAATKSRSISNLLGEPVGRHVLLRFFEYLEQGVFRQSESLDDIFKGIEGFAVQDLIHNWILRRQYPGYSHTAFRPGKIVVFERNTGTGSGLIHVDNMATLYFDSNNRLWKKRLRSWKIQIAEGGFNTILRGNDPDDPFPDNDAASGLPDFMKDHFDLRSIWARNLITKLVAKGTSIKILSISQHYEWMENDTVVQSDQFTFPDGDPLYTSTENSCIDILFDTPEPPTDILGFPEQRGYCLGRCAHPFVVNSW